jgi:hypothetical protein
MNHIEYVNLVAVSVAGKRLLDGAPGSKLHEVRYIHDDRRTKNDVSRILGLG